MSTANEDSLSEYERNALEQARQHKQQQLERSPRHLIPSQVRESAGSRVEKIEGRLRDSETGAKVLAKTGAAYQRAAGGAAKAIGKFAQASAPHGRVLRAYSRRGYDVAELRGLRQLDLSIVDRVRPRRLDVAYAGLAGLEGLIAGGVISGGEALATFGSVASAGAAAAPGFGTVAAAVGADAGFVIAAGSRAVAHTALYYGYDPSDPGEQMFMMSVLSLGTSATAGAKYVAYRELSQLTQQLARRATWNVLNEHVLTRVAQKFASSMSTRLTQRKLGQLVPVAGMFVGAGLNYAMIDDICEAAHWAYRERFLTDKLGATDGLWMPPPPQDAPVGEVEGDAERAVSVIEILEEARQDEQNDGGRADVASSSDSEHE
jgi:hypothetical protein